jgi:hypothetical protein
MARIAGAVAPGFPHHVIQRGSRRQQTFFNDEDYLAYLELMLGNVFWRLRHRKLKWSCSGNRNEPDDHWGKMVFRRRWNVFWAAD